MGHFYNIKRHFNFDEKEKKAWGLSGLIIAIILFFFIWRTTDFNLQTGTTHFILLLINSYLMLGVLISLAKIMAIFKKHTAHYTSWLNGLLVGFVISFISYGYIPVAFPGNIELRNIERLRHGRVFPGENKVHISFTLTMTFLSMILITMILQGMYTLTSLIFFKYSVIAAAALLIFAVLPFPHNIGVHLFFTNRKRYYFMSLFTIGFAIGVLAGSSYAILIGLLLGTIMFYIAKNPKYNPLEKPD